MGKFHFLDVGFGDTSIMITSSYIFLVDCLDIHKYKHLLPDNKRITALFITHQHYDHFMGMRYLMNNRYEIDYLICSPYVRRHDDNSVEYDEWWDFRRYASYFESRGSKTIKPYRQNSFAKPWWEISGLKIWMLGPPKHIANKSTRELHDASLVFLAIIGHRKCLFTGDASDESLNWIANNTKGICDDILHASHHGSLNGADLEFLKKCAADYTVISTKSGVKPSVPHPTALKRYERYTKSEVYRTDHSGSLSCSF